MVVGGRGELEPGQVADAASLAAVADGAIVSRKLVEAEGGRVVLFAFDEGQALSEHTTPYEALVHVLEGVLDVTIAGKGHRVAAGGVIRMPGGVPHALVCREPARMMLVMLAR